MPFDKPTAAGDLAPFPLKGPVAASVPEPIVDFGEVMKAALRTENTIGSALNAMSGARLENQEIDHDHNPLDLIKDTRYEENRDAFIGSINEEDTRRRMARLDQEFKDRDLLNSGAAGVTAGLVAGLFDLPSLLPGGAIYRSAKGGVKIGKSIALTSAAGAGAGLATETALQATQLTRTAAESVMTIAASTILAGMLGGAAAGLSRKAAQNFEARLETDLDLPLPENDKFTPGNLADEDLTANASGIAQAQGASDRSAASPAGAQISNNEANELEGALGVEKVVGIQDPMIRSQRSPFQAVRQIVESLAETPLQLKKASRGIAQAPGGSVETRIKAWQVGLAQSVEDLDDAFSQYYFGRERRKFDRARAALSPNSEKMTFEDFKAEIAHAMRNKDQHAIPEVQEAARSFREKVFEPLKEEAIEQGLLDPDISIETADSYFSRLYNKERIVARRGDFKAKIIQWLTREREEAGRLRDISDKDLADIDESLAGLRSLIRQGITERKGEKIRRKVAKEKGREQEARRNLKTQEVDQARAAARVDELTEEQVSAAASAAYNRNLLKDLKAQNLPVETVSDAIAKFGGVNDSGGEVRAILGTNRRSRLINKKDGMGLDVMARRLHDEGYFQNIDFDDLSPDDVLDALAKDIGGERIVSVHNADRLHYVDAVDDLRRELEKGGFDILNATPEKLQAWFEGARLPHSKPKLAGRLAEARLNHRRRINRVLFGDKRVDDVQQTLNEIQQTLDDLRVASPEITKRLNKFRKGVKQNVAARKKAKRESAKFAFRAGRSDLELDSLADEIIDRILGTPDGRLPYDAHKEGGPAGRLGNSQRGGLAGPLKARLFNIPDSLIEEFLENDVEAVARIYTRSMAPDVELQRRYQSVDMTEEMKKISNEANRAIDGAKTQKEYDALQKAKDVAIRDIAAMRDRLRGTYGLPSDPSSMLVRAGRVVRSLNYLRLLGGMTISAIPDLARTMMVHGTSKAYGDTVAALATNLNAVKLAAEEVKLAGTAWDMVLDTRSMALADVMDDFGRNSRFERGVQSLGSKFGLISLMAPWNAALKQFSGVVVMTRALQAAETVAKGGKLDQGTITRLAQIGIDEQMLHRIWQQFSERGGEIDGGVYLPNTVGWNDREVIEALRGAIVRDVDRVIVTPGQDKPLFMSTEAGALIMQFKSFAFASAQRTMLAGLQQRDASVLNGVLLTMALGAGAYAIKQKLRGEEVSDNPRVFLAEAFDHSGLSGWFMEGNNMAAKFTRGRVSLSGEPMSRYASRNVLGAFLGPTAGMIQDTFTVGGAVSSGEFSEGSTRALRRLLPLQNVFYIRGLLDKTEAGVNGAFGISP